MRQNRFYNPLCFLSLGVRYLARLVAHYRWDEGQVDARCASSLYLFLIYALAATTAIPTATLLGLDAQDLSKRVLVYAIIFFTAVVVWLTWARKPAFHREIGIAIAPGVMRGAVVPWFFAMAHALLVVASKFRPIPALGALVLTWLLTALWARSAQARITAGRA
jgi:hypothetical protein